MLIRIAKNSMLAMLLSIICCFGAKAQNYQEVVYLKNGSIIKGLIVEQIPNVSLTVQTTDGSTIICDMADVQKITKEAVSTRDKEPIAISNDPYGWESAPRYRGFVGESVTVDFYYEDVASKVFTSHGCLISPYIYVGGGLGVQYWVDEEEVDVPIFAHARGEFHKSFRKNVSPYWDAKMGYTVGYDSGFYFAPQVGCHFYFSHSKFGLGIGLGYEGTVDYWDGLIGGLEISFAFDF